MVIPWIFRKSMGIATPVYGLARDDVVFLLFFFKLVGADAAKGAFVILGQFIAFVDIATDDTDILFHTGSSLFILIHSRQRPVKVI